MSDKKFTKDYQALDRHMTQCERLLAKVKQCKVKEARQMQASKARNESVRKVEPRPRVSASQQHLPTAGHRPTLRSVNTVRKSPAEAPVAARPAADTSGKGSDARAPKKSSSVSHLPPPPTCKCPSILETESRRAGAASVQGPHAKAATEAVAPPKAPPPKAQDAPPRRTARPKSPARNKHLSWAEILAQNHQVRHQPQPTGSALNPRPSHSDGKTLYTTEHPHECEPPASVPHFHCDRRDHGNNVARSSSYSSEDSSGFSSTTEVAVSVTNKSVQCEPPPDQCYHRLAGGDHKSHKSSSSSGTSSRMDDHDTQGLLASDAHLMFNPVRVLNFLTRELHGQLMKKPQEDKSAHRIIAEMERVLRRLPEEQWSSSAGAASAAAAAAAAAFRTKQTSPAPSMSTQSTDDKIQMPPPQSKRPFGINEVEKNLLQLTLQAYPSLAKKIERQTEALRKKVVGASTNVQLPIIPESSLSPEENVLFYQKYIEVSCEQLELMTDAMEKKYDELTHENKNLQSTLRAKEEELVKEREREQDYITAVGHLRANLESLTLRETRLSAENKTLKEQVKDAAGLLAVQKENKHLLHEMRKLREENKSLPGLKYIEEKYEKLAAENRQLKEENKKLEGALAVCNRGGKEALRGCSSCLRLEREAHTLRVEREALALLGRSKDDELEQHRGELRAIQKLVESHLECVRSGAQAFVDCSPPSSLESLLSSGSASGCSSHHEDAGGEAPQHLPAASSSPNSSSSKVMDKEWDEISTILPEGPQLSPEMVITLPPRELVDSEGTCEFTTPKVDSWHTMVVDARGDRTGHPQQQPHPPHHSESGLPGSSSNGSGEQPPAKDLRQTIHELLRLVHQKPGKPRYRPHRQNAVVERSRSAPQQSLEAESSTRSFRFEMPVLPTPPKFIDTPHCSEVSSLTGSHVDMHSSLDSDHAVSDYDRDPTNRND